MSPLILTTLCKHTVVGASDLKQSSVDNFCLNIHDHHLSQFAVSIIEVKHRAYCCAIAKLLKSNIMYIDASEP